MVLLKEENAKDPTLLSDLVKGHEDGSHVNSLLELVSSHSGREILFNSASKFFNMLPPDIIANWIIGSDFVRAQSLLSFKVNFSLSGRPLPR